MFHQVFICDSTEDPDCLTNLVPEQNSLDDAAQVFKEEQNSSENSVVGCEQTEDLKIPVEELKSEKCRVVSNQIVLTTDTPVATKLDLESDSFVNVTESCSNLATKTEETFVLPSTSADTVDPLQIPLGRPLGQIIVQQPLSADTKPTFVHPPSVDNSDLQIKPSIETLLGANDTAVKFLPGTLVDPVTQMMGLSPGAPTQEPLLKTLKLEPTTTLDSEADIKTSQEQLTSELSDADVDDSLIMIKREGIVSEDQHLDLAKSEVRNEAVSFQDSNYKEDIMSQLKIVCSGTKREAEGLNLFMHNPVCELQGIENNPKPEKCFETKISDINEDEFRYRFNIKKCFVLVNKSAISDTRQDSNLTSKVEPVLNDFGNNSSSDRGELDDSVDDISNSDWEEEFLSEQNKNKKKIKIRGCRKVGYSNKDPNPTYISAKKVDEKCKNSSQCKGDSGLLISSITMRQNSASGSTSSNILPNNRNDSEPQKIKNQCKSNFLSGNLVHLNNKNKLQSQKEVCFKVVNKKFSLCTLSGGQIIKTTPLTKNSIKEITPVPGSIIRVQSNIDSCEVKDSTFAAQTNIVKVKRKLPRKILPKESIDNHSKINTEESDIFLPQDPYFTYNCDKCGRSFELIDRYHYHLKYSVCQGYKINDRFQCSICDRRFNSRGKKEAHENSHTNARPFKCSDCEKCFNSKAARQMHYKKMHLNKRISYLCYFCGYMSVNFAHILAHEESHRIPEGTEMPKPFKCAECGRGYISLYLKQKHHSREHTLKKCGKCSEKFKSQAQLRNHMESAHDIVKTHVCEKCGKQFKHSHSLRDHRNAVHSTVSLYSCESCDKTFKRKGNLRQHMITHSDERPISCSECGDTFKRITHLKQHVAAVHGDCRKT